jgi:hypothetical protein
LPISCYRVHRLGKMSIPIRMHLTPLVPDKSDDHRVEVEEEHQKVETKLDEGLLLVHVELPEDLRGVEQVLVLEDPVVTFVSIVS